MERYDGRLGHRGRVERFVTWPSTEGSGVRRRSELLGPPPVPADALPDYTHLATLEGEPVPARKSEADLLIAELASKVA